MWKVTVNKVKGYIITALGNTKYCVHLIHFIKVWPILLNILKLYVLSFLLTYFRLDNVST